jgi:hypothetical protein
VTSQTACCDQKQQDQLGCHLHRDQCGALTAGYRLRSNHLRSGAFTTSFPAAPRLAQEDLVLAILLGTNATRAATWIPWMSALQSGAGPRCRASADGDFLDVTEPRPRAGPSQSGTLSESNPIVRVSVQQAGTGPCCHIGADTDYVRD